MEAPRHGPPEMSFLQKNEEKIIEEIIALMHRHPGECCNILSQKIKVRLDFRSASESVVLPATL